MSEDAQVTVPPRNSGAVQGDTASRSADEPLAGLATSRKPTLLISVRDKSLAVGKPLIAFVIALFIWQASVSFHVVPSIAVPPPGDVVTYIREHPGLLFSQSWATLRIVLISFAVASVSGGILGILISQFRIIEESLMPLMVLIQVIPSVAIAPILVILLGYGALPKIATATIIAFFPIVVNTLAGIKALDDDMYDLSRSLGARRVLRLRFFALPNSLPYVFAGIRISIALSVIGTVVGEFVTADSGLGYLILKGSGFLEPAQTFAALVFLAIIGIGLFFIVRATELIAIPWARRANA